MSTRRLPRHRFAAWLATGPLGRTVGFVLDLITELRRPPTRQR